MRIVPVLAVSSSLAVVLACSPADQQVLSTYFTAVQGGDEAIVSGVSLVEFPGEVRSWEILEVGPEVEEAFELTALREKFAEVEQELEAVQQENQAFGEENIELYRQYHDRKEKDPDAELRGALAEFGTEWESRMAKQTELEDALEEVRSAISNLRNEARLSMRASVNDNYAGAVKAKEFRCKVNDGKEDKTYKIIMKRYELADQERNITPMARWIITHIEEQEV